MSHLNEHGYPDAWVHPDLTTSSLTPGAYFEIEMYDPVDRAACGMTVDQRGLMWPTAAWVGELVGVDGEVLTHEALQRCHVGDPVTVPATVSTDHGEMEHTHG